jgi:hypothetical protein
MNLLSNPPVPAVAALADWGPAFDLTREPLRPDDSWAVRSLAGTGHSNLRSNRS